MLSKKDIDEYIKIIEMFWPGELELDNEESDKLEYFYYENNLHKLVFDKDTGRISIGC